jgi:flagellar basal-body rod protein FlgB
MIILNRIGGRLDNQSAQLLHICLAEQDNPLSDGKNRMLGDMLFKNSNLPLISRSLDASMLRARVISNNIANVNTPGYRRVEVAFEDQLQSALDRTRLKGASTQDQHFNLGRKDFSQVNAEAYHPYDPTLPSGVNNVDIDTEMAKLAETQLSYSFAIKRVQGVFKKMNAAIQGKSIQS